MEGKRQPVPRAVGSRRAEHHRPGCRMNTHSIHQRELFCHHLWGEGEEIRLPVPNPVLLHQLEGAAAVVHSYERRRKAEPRIAAASRGPP